MDFKNLASLIPQFPSPEYTPQLGIPGQAALLLELCWEGRALPGEGAWGGKGELWDMAQVGEAAGRE